MRRCIHSYPKLAAGLLAATGVAGLTAGAILAQSNPPGPPASTQDEPIKRTVCSGAIWREHRARRLSCSSRT
jgi:hypothetical protein